MPATDQCEPAVVNALAKDGWKVTHHSFFLRTGPNEGVYADLRLQHEDQKRSIIIIEVKCFADKRKLMDDFYGAVGQYILYRNVLRLKNITADLFLSVPLETHNTFFQRKSI